MVSEAVRASCQTAMYVLSWMSPPRVAKKIRPPGAVPYRADLGGLATTRRSTVWARRGPVHLAWHSLDAMNASATLDADEGVEPARPRRSDLDLWRREITVRGKGGRARVVRIGHEAARSRSWHAGRVGCDAGPGAGGHLSPGGG